MIEGSTQLVFKFSNISRETFVFIECHVPSGDDPVLCRKPDAVNVGGVIADQVSNPCFGVQALMQSVPFELGIRVHSKRLTSVDFEMGVVRLFVLCDYAISHSKIGVKTVVR